MSKDSTMHPDRLADMFKDKTVFITGGTGFLGKVLLEKILRCTEIRKVYLLVRQRKNKDHEERLRVIFESPLFDLLRQEKGDKVFARVNAVKGDVEDVDLAISKKDRLKLTEETDFIYHAAATIRFDDYLKKSVLLNVRGTKYVLNLARQCKNLKLFVHISTAFCHSNEEVVEEKIYEPLKDPEEIVLVCESLDTDAVEKSKKELLGDYPNSYGFTKALAEGLVNKEMDNLPIIIVRPSIVIPIWKEPLPGWTDNINGPTGLLIAAGKGILRTMYGDKNNCADYVPVDVVVNATLCITYYVLHYNDKKRVFNVTSSLEHQVSFESVIKLGQEIIDEIVPLNWVLWYPGGSMTNSRFVHNVKFFVFQLLPAICIDAILIVIGVGPVLWKVQMRIWRGYEVFEYYVNKRWVFKNEGSLKARSLMNPREKEIYKVDSDGMDYKQFFTNCIFAARRYILKETDDTIPTARIHLKIMWFVDKLCKVLIVLGVFYLIWKSF